MAQLQDWVFIAHFRVVLLFLFVMVNYRTCVFCGKNDSPPSREDALAKWIAREFQSGKFEVQRIIHTAPDICDRSTYIVDSDTTYKSYDGFGIISRKPCQRCNNTWMSKLEGQAKSILIPLMQDKKPSLTQDERSVIARWFIKTVMVFEFIGGMKERLNYFGSEERHSIMKSLAMPVPTLVYLGRYKGSLACSIHETKLPFITKTRDGHSVSVDGYSATFTIKSLALQVFTMRWPKDLTGQASISIPGRWSDVVVELWPLHCDIIWPPPLILDDEGLDLFSHRWLTARP